MLLRVVTAPVPLALEKTVELSIRGIAGTVDKVRSVKGRRGSGSAVARVSAAKATRADRGSASFSADGAVCWLGAETDGWSWSTNWMASSFSSALEVVAVTPDLELEACLALRCFLLFPKTFLRRRCVPLPSSSASSPLTMTFRCLEPTVSLGVRAASVKVTSDGVSTLDMTGGVSCELALDLRRRRPRKTRFSFLAVVCEPDESVELLSEELDESDEEDDEVAFRTFASTPG